MDIKIIGEIIVSKQLIADLHIKQMLSNTAIYLKCFWSHDQNPEGNIWMYNNTITVKCTLMLTRHSLTATAFI